MKKFFVIVTIWLLVQLIFASGVKSYNDAKNRRNIKLGATWEQLYQEKCSVTGPSPEFAFVLGMIFPITNTTFFKDDLCSYTPFDRLNATSM
jgi:hypothetical protein